METQTIDALAAFQARVASRAKKHAENFDYELKLKFNQENQVDGDPTRWDPPHPVWGHLRAISVYMRVRQYSWMEPPWVMTPSSIVLVGSAPEGDSPEALADIVMDVIDAEVSAIVVRRRTSESLRESGSPA